MTLWVYNMETNKSHFSKQTGTDAGVQRPPQRGLSSRAGELTTNAENSAFQTFPFPGFKIKEYVEDCYFLGKSQVSTT